MVSRRASPLTPSTRDRLHATAIEEFALHGFDGATVDRIAVRARVNKAMIYYHFGSKAGLYQAVVTDVFQGVASAVARVAQSAHPADAKIRLFIEAVADEATRPHFPALWLREMADGGRHVTVATARVMGQILGALASILDEGRRAHTIRPVPPLIAHLAIVAPVLLFSASAALRARLGKAVPMASEGVSREALLEHVTAATLAVLQPSSARRRRSGPRRPSP